MSHSSDQNTLIDLVERSYNEISSGQYETALKALLNVDNSASAVENYFLCLAMCFTRMERIGSALTSLSEELSKFPQNDHAKELLRTLLSAYQLGYKNQYELRWLLHMIPRDSFIVDVGSNVGNFIEPFIREGYRAISIEPCEKSCNLQGHRFRESIEAGKLELYKVACSAESHQAELFVSDDPCATYSTLDSSKVTEFNQFYQNGLTEAVHVEPLSKILAQSAISSSTCGVVKIDCMGHECQVFEELLSNVAPPLSIMVQLYNSAGAAEQAKRVLTKLSTNGYPRLKLFLSWGRLLLHESKWLTADEIEARYLNYFEGVKGSAPTDVPTVNLLAVSKEFNNVPVIL